MITPFVMRAFDRLADAALMDVARSAPPAPDPSHTDRFMEEAFKLDSDMRSAFENAKRDDAAAGPGEEPDKEKMFREVFEQMLESIAHGGTQSARAVSAGDATRLMNTIRMVLEKTLKGEDRKKKSVGIRARLWDFGEALSKSETRDSAARGIADFVQETFSGEIDRLVRSYWWSRSRLTGGLKSALLTQEAGGDRRKAKEQAGLHVFRMLLEGVRQAIKTEAYAQKPSDAAALGAIAQGVWYRIRNRATGDQYDGETAATAGGKYARAKWGQYIAPLQDTGRFGDRGALDTLGITEFLNEHFLRRDLGSGTPVEAPLPGGGTMTAPSFKTKLKHTTVHTWATAGLPPASLDAPLSPDGRTLAETIGGQDQPSSEQEGWQIEHLDSPADPAALEKLKAERIPLPEGPREERDRILDAVRTNKDLLRAKLRGWIEEAAAGSSIREIKTGPGTRQEVSDENKDAIKDIVLVKFGFMSEGDGRDGFKRRWLDERKHLPKYYATPMSDDDWKAIGKPLKKVRGGDAPRKLYEKDWKQNALLNKETGQPPDSTPEVLKSPGDFELVTVTHRKGEAADPRHLTEWHKYSREQREADLDRGLDTYGPKWFEQSISEAVMDELKKSHGDLADVLEKFSPEKIFVSVAKTTDQEMARAMGFIRPSVAPQANTLHPNYPALQAGIKAVIRNLVRIMEERKNEDEVSVLQYIGLKRLGRIASVAT